MKLEVVHSTHFRYSGPIAETVMEVRLRPMDGLGQRCLEFELDVSSGVKPRSYRDGYGNNVHYFNLVRPHSRLSVTSRSVVETGGEPDADPGEDLVQDFWKWVLIEQKTPLVREPGWVRAVASNLDALAAVWRWTDRDVLTHGLPLFHVHGLVLGVLGSLRAGGTLRYVGRFSPEEIAAELRAGATMLFAVPTMYHALAEAAERDPTVRDALGAARLLVSGSAPLPVREFRRIEAATGRRIVERYGLTETLMNCATPGDAEPRPGSVGPPLPGVDLRLVDDEGGALDPDDSESIGEVLVRGPNLFLGYLNRPESTAEVVRDGWFSTGDLATRDAGGWVRIVGRRATDLIKTGGYKVGAGEVEAALLEHPAVTEAAVLGEPDDRLGERIVAWVVLRPEAAGSVASRPSAAELADHVAASLAPHKRPRDVRFVDALPRNEMGKVRKGALREPPLGSA